MESALRRARHFGGPVIVHAVTRKGCGYPPAENDAAEQMHSPAAFDPLTGLPTGPASVGWTSVFGEEMVALGQARPDVVAITAAMLGPTGLAAFAEAFPDRCFDVGIAEQHALTSAAGLAAGGLHPVVAIYSTFLNRAFDQLLMDVALHRQAVTLVLDRAGVTGNDGPSHNGMWDLSILGVVPGIRVAAPRDAVTLREELAEAVAVDDGPTALRFPKGAVIASVPAVRRIGGVDVLREPAPSEGPTSVLLVCVGAFGELGVAAAERLAAQGVAVTVVDPRWVLPVPDGAGRAGRRARARRHRERQRAARRLRFGPGRRPAGRRVRRAAARPRPAPAVPRARQPGRPARRGRADGPGRRAPGHGVGLGAARRAGRRRGGGPRRRTPWAGGFGPDGMGGFGPEEQAR